MRKIREVLRLKYACGASDRVISRSVGIGRTAIVEYVRRAAVIGISWPIPEELDDTALERKLFAPAGYNPPRSKPLPDWGYVHAELRRRGVTLALLWEEYRGHHPDGYGYSRFCDLYVEWRHGITATMRQTHAAGEKLFVDFAGDTVPVFDGLTAFDDQQRQPDVTALTFEQRLGLMIDREATERENKRLIVRLKFASLRQTAIVEDVDLRAPRGIDRAFFARLVDGDWIGRKQNLLITGPTGVGKSWIACALGHKACRDNRSVLYHRLPRLFEALALARGDGRYARLLKTLSRVDLLILDDWGLAPLTGDQRRDLLEVVDDRHQRGSTIITSQVPIENWHEVIADPTIADAVLDRLVHNAHRLALKGDSMRKITALRANLDATKKT
jgi:DNA replication protein DnaC